MLDLLDIPRKCVCDIDIAPEKMIADPYRDAVSAILWHASLKPSFIGAAAVKNKTIRYEEIQVLQVTLSSTDFLYDIANCIYKKIKYPCLLVFKLGDKYMCGTCQFTAGKTDYDDNILRSINFSHWVHPDCLSTGAQKMIAAINSALNEKSDLLAIYTQISQSVEFFRLSGITKAHVDRLLKDMLGHCSPKKRDGIMKYCTPYKKHFVIGNSVAAKYNKTKRTSEYEYRYDCEDIWYCFMKYEPTRKVIVGRRYRDIEDLVFTIDQKIEDNKDRW